MSRRAKAGYNTKAEVVGLDTEGFCALPKQAMAEVMQCLSTTALDVLPAETVAEVMRSSLGPGSDAMSDGTLHAL